MDRMMLAFDQASPAGRARMCGLSGHGSPWYLGAAAIGPRFGTTVQNTTCPPRRLGMRQT